MWRCTNTDFNPFRLAFFLYCFARGGFACLDVETGYSVFEF
jgi:hypothetical protein